MSRIEDLEKRLVADPNSKIFVQLAEEYRKAGLQEDAIATCRDGLEKHPNYFSARFALGRALLESNALEEAREEFEKVLQQVPDNLLALKFLGETYQGLGHLQEALSKYQLASTLSPEDTDLVDRIGQVEAAIAAPAVPAQSASYKPEFGIPSADEPMQSEPMLLESIEPLESVEPIPLDPSLLEQVNEPVAPVQPVQPVRFVGRVGFGVTEGPTPAEPVEPIETIEEDKPGLATETLAELYASQGHLDRALWVYRQLVATQPDNVDLRGRLEELEMLVKASEEPTPPERGGGGAARGRADSNVPALEEAVRALEGWLVAIGRS